MTPPTNLVDVQDHPSGINAHGWITVDVTMEDPTMGIYFENRKFNTTQGALDFIDQCKRQLCTSK